MAKIPASIRTNNPGAMYPGPAATKFGSKRYEVLTSKDGTHQIAIFDDPVLGGAAMFFLLASKTYTGRTIQQAIAKWCGGFAVTTYLKVLEEKGGVNRDTMLTRELVLVPEVGIPLARAMAWQEAGMDYPMNDEQWATSHGIAFGRIPMPESQPVIAPRQPVDIGEDIPASPTVVAIEAPAAKLRTSGTIWGTIAAALAYVSQWAETAVAFGLEWAAELALLLPLKSLVLALSGNVKAWTTGMVFGALSLVATRRVKATLEGKKG